LVKMREVWNRVNSVSVISSPVTNANATITYVSNGTIYLVSHIAHTLSYARR
jgi:hypothetical protein